MQLIDIQDKYQIDNLKVKNYNLKSQINLKSILGFSYLKLNFFPTIMFKS